MMHGQKNIKLHFNIFLKFVDIFQFCLKKIQSTDIAFYENLFSVSRPC